ncbi:MAG: MBL fold metallo-hydrolase [Ferruginibacter sp.]
MMKSLLLLSCLSQNVFAQINSAGNIVAPTDAFTKSRIVAHFHNDDSISVRLIQIEHGLYFMDCINGFGGGNVIASAGDDGILLVDDMYAVMAAKLQHTLDSVSGKPVRIILNTHFHSDHIEGNKMFGHSAVIIAHENVSKRLLQKNTAAKPTTAMMPAVTFSDSLTLHFNGEDIKMIHFPNGHTDGDAVIYFTRSKILHLGDMFFFGMFPAVYTEGGGNIKQLIINLDKILEMIPAETHVIPGHGDPATKQDLSNYINMLKETTSIVETKIKAGTTLEQMIKEKVLAKYDALGSGGAQTTDQYLSMLYKLLLPGK